MRRIADRAFGYCPQTKASGIQAQIPVAKLACEAPKTRAHRSCQQVNQQVIQALFAAATLAGEPPQFSLWFALRAAVLRLAVRGWCSVALAAAVPIVWPVVLAHFNRRCACRVGTIRPCQAA